MTLREVGLVLPLALCAGCVLADAMEPISHLAFIDHYNLRKMYQFEETQLDRQVQEIKRNMDKACEYGVGTYILFSRSFEGLVNYDFSVDELGDLTGVVYPLNSEHRRKQEIWGRRLNDVLGYARAKGLKVIFHTNQFDFPDSLYELAGQKMGGTARVCPGKPVAYNLLKGKIAEFFEKYPECAGLQVTISETQVKPTECNCDACKDLSEADRFARVAQAVRDACVPAGKIAMIRTWGQFETTEVMQKLPQDIICSTKFTLPDFHLTNYPNPIMGMDGGRQEIEFDGWGEYSGYNLFPCYYGDVFAERIRECSKRGVKRLGIRLNWEPGLRYIFGVPYGNEVNVHVFARLAANPNMNPDDALSEYVRKVYPESAWAAAFKLYKRSFHLQRTWLTWRGGNANDHSRVWSGGVERVKSQIGTCVPENYEETAKAIAERRRAVDDAYREALRLISDLGPDVPEDWKRDLRECACRSWFVAQANCDNILLVAAYREHQQGRQMPNISKIADEVRKRTQMWRLVDGEMFDKMMGYGAEKMLEQVEKSTTK